MNDEELTLEESLEEETPVVTPDDKPQYMTKEEFAAQMNEFKESLVTGLSKRNEPEAPTPAGDPKFFDGWEPETASDVQRFVAAEVAKVHQMYAPVVASSEAEKVVSSLTSDMPVATQRYVTDMVNKMGLSPTQIRQLASNQEGIDYIQTLAAGHSARQAKIAPVLKSSDPGGAQEEFQVPANQKANMEEFVQSMSQFMTRKEAEKTFKETVKARN